MLVVSIGLLALLVVNRVCGWPVAFIGGLLKLWAVLSVTFLGCHFVTDIETNNSACLIKEEAKKEEIGGDGLHGKGESVVWIPASMTAAVLLSPRKLETKIVVDKVVA